MDNVVAPLVEMIGISKSYGGVHACRDIDLTVRAGEVHALLGENGAGRSTLMRILSGDVTDYAGEIRIAGEPQRFTAPLDAQRAGVAMIHQELDLVPSLSVAENIFLGRELRNRLRAVDRRRTNQVTGGLLERCGVALDPRRPVGELRTGEQQLVTIAKALSLDARVLIMDEPTSALSPAEVEQMFTVIAERAAEAMVGRPVQTLFHTTDVEAGEEVLRVTDLVLAPRRERSGRREPGGISLTVRRGEIVGLGGLLGSGRTELLETLYGAGSPGTVHGEILFRGRPFRPRGPRRSVQAGMAFVPEDRRVAGLAIEHSVLANTVLSIVDRISTAGFVPRAKETGAVSRIVGDLKVKLGSVGDAVGTLSGGNHHKVVFGRMLLTDPALLLLDEPTCGVDVGAKAEIYQLLGEAAQRGIGVLLASSELAELVGVCDRVVVLSGGKSVRELDTRHAGEADLLAASMGDLA